MAGFRGLLELLGLWPSKPPSGPLVPDVVGLVTEVAAALNTTEAALRHNVIETLADLNVTTQETAIIQ